MRSLCIYFGMPQKKAEEAKPSEFFDLWRLFFANCESAWKEEEKAIARRIFEAVAIKRKEKKAAAVRKVDTSQVGAKGQSPLRKKFMNLRKSKTTGMSGNDDLVLSKTQSDQSHHISRSESLTVEGVEPLTPTAEISENSAVDGGSGDQGKADPLAVIRSKSADDYLLLGCDDSGPLDEVLARAEKEMEKTDPKPEEKEDGSAESEKDSAVDLNGEDDESNWIDGGQADKMKTETDQIPVKTTTETVIPTSDIAQGTEDSAVVAEQKPTVESRGEVDYSSGRKYVDRVSFATALLCDATPPTPSPTASPGFVIVPTDSDMAKVSEVTGRETREIENFTFEEVGEGLVPVVVGEEDKVGGLLVGVESEGSFGVQLRNVDSITGEDEKFGGATPIISDTSLPFSPRSPLPGTSSSEYGENTFTTVTGATGQVVSEPLKKTGGEGRSIKVKGKTR
eukprot:comp22678_c0_seq1/m.35076 comp22678_c0_seq1/g.35076  ORF comp22678_c0_seq1/g.35076 comp22678_c0_seq1/m.35076 type:complete len:452 (-) comp22678_c0_seq1:441-1796(-)